MEGNGLSSLEGLQACTGLVCLFAQQNRLGPDLDPAWLAPLTNLDTLQLGSNQLSGLEGLRPCTRLATLTLSGNRLATVASLEPLAALPLLSSLDVTHNGLDGDGEALVSLLIRLRSLRALYLRAGNPIADALRPFRKRLVAVCPALCYLDEAPVFAAERRAAEAWAAGGAEAEAASRAADTAERARLARANFEHITALREGARARRAAAGGPPSDDDDGGGDGGESGGGGGGDDSAPAADAPACGEPAELVAALERLAAYPPSGPVERGEEEEPLDLVATREALRAAGRAADAAALRAPRADELERFGRAAFGAAQAGAEGEWGGDGGGESDGRAAGLPQQQTRRPQGPPDGGPASGAGFGCGGGCDARPARAAAAASLEELD